MNLPKPALSFQSIFINFLKSAVLSLLVLMTIPVKGQAFYNLTNTLCAGNTVSVYAQSGTISATSFTWSSLPGGPLFSSANASLCDIYFPTAGVYTIDLEISGGTTTSMVSHTITVYALPVLTLTSSASPLCANDGATLAAAGAISYSWNPSAGLYFLSNLHDLAYVTPPLTTGYSVTGASSVGCQGSAVFTIVVNQLPNLVLSSNTTSICAGSFATLTGFGAANYTWTSNTFSAPLIQTTLSAGAGSYSLIGANGNCKDSTFVIINLVPNLSLSVTASRFSICKNDGDSIVPIVLNGAGATSYTWEPFQPGRMTYSLGPTTAVSPSSSICYTLTGATDFCNGKTVVCVQVVTCTALEEERTQSSFLVFPNPAQDKLVVRSSFRGSALLKVINMTGQVLINENKEMSTEEQVLSIQHLPAGIYFVSFEAQGQTPHLVRVIKQ